MTDTSITFREMPTGFDRKPMIGVFHGDSLVALLDRGGVNGRLSALTPFGPLPCVVIGWASLEDAQVFFDSVAAVHDQGLSDRQIASGIDQEYRARCTA